MILNELNGYHNSEEISAYKKIMHGVGGINTDTGLRNQTKKTFIRYMENRGYRVQGFGALGVVLTHPSLDYCIKIFRNDPGYLSFVKLAQGNPNPHFPRFRGRFMRIDKQNYAVRMETLTPFDINPRLHLLIDLFIKQKNSIEDFVLSLRPLLQTTVEENLSLFEAVQILKINKSEWTQFDLHTQNFMLRGNMIVIIDPFLTRL